MKFWEHLIAGHSYDFVFKNCLKIEFISGFGVELSKGIRLVRSRKWMINGWKWVLRTELHWENDENVLAVFYDASVLKPEETSNSEQANGFFGRFGYLSHWRVSKGTEVVGASRWLFFVLQRWRRRFWFLSHEFKGEVIMGSFSVHI